MLPVSGSATNRTSRATSSTVPVVSVAVSFRMNSSRCGGTVSVAVGPGATTFTVMRRAPSSRAHARFRLSSAAFVAPYTPCQIPMTGLDHKRTRPTCRTYREGQVALMRCRATNQDDAPTVREQRLGGLDGGERGVDVDVPHVLVLLGGQLLRAAKVVHTGVEDQHVQLAEASVDGADLLGGLLRIAQIGAEHLGAPTLGLDLAEDFARLVLRAGVANLAPRTQARSVTVSIRASRRRWAIEARREAWIRNGFRSPRHHSTAASDTYRDGGTTGGQFQGDAGADAAAGTGHQGDLAAQRQPAGGFLRGLLGVAHDEISWGAPVREARVN